MRKKLMAISLVTMMAAGLVACGNESSQTGNNETTQANPAQTDSTQGTTTDDAAGKTLVVYYSASGNTRAVAEMLAEQTDADIFELVPVDVYTSGDLDWTDDDSRVSVEHDNVDERDVELTSVTVDNWEEYDTVYIGYPIWWGIAAWPVDNFIKSNDFSGKTVIPFATAASSGMGRSGELLEEMAGTGNWLEGECFRGSTSDDDVKSWLESLGL